jgi:hypothetical protein
MNYWKRYITAAVAAVIFSGLVSCNDNKSADNAGGSANDTNLTDTRRNSGDTSGYLKHDSANQMPTLETNEQ